MDIAVISIAAFLASALTLFSGFGLGTLLMPVAAIFFPIDLAIAITAIVHLANNLFMVALVGKFANRAVLLSFGAPAVIFAFLGALVLVWLSGAAPVLEYFVFHRQIQIFPVKLTIGLLILSFVIFELSPWFSSIALDRKYLPFGGLISGFFGGLSGHQGAFRSIFLLKAGLRKEEFIATSVALAVMVDISRMVIYGWDMSAQHQDIEWPLVIAASFSAFAGAYFSARMLKKITIVTVRIIASTLLSLVALGLISGAL